MWYYPEEGDLVYLVGDGYSGAAGKCQNNSDCQGKENTGPIPQGYYVIGKQRDNKTSEGVILKRSMRLTPYSRNKMLGRAGFLIHNGNMKTKRSSKGCIVLPNAARKIMGDHLSISNILEVVK